MYEFCNRFKQFDLKKSSVKLTQNVDIAFWSINLSVCYDSNDKYIIGSHIVFVLFDWPLYIMFTLVFFHRMNELSRKYKQLQKDKESADHTINKLSKTVQERDEEIDSLVEEVAMWELYTVNATHVYILHTTINANWEG